MRKSSNVIDSICVQTYLLNETAKQPKPLFVFPNSQHEIAPINFQQLPYRIVSLKTWDSHGIGLVLDAANVLLIPGSPSGYFSALPNKNDDIAVYKSKPSIPGTYQIHRSFGPCFICQPGSKNYGSAGKTCVACATNDTL
ncbi:unnamed protein product [Rotaria sp. Silwood1]|nr:unnamed protein product [Rotaria sp. Silwood1]CAF3881747.1 unnamed protein product [Rotaria sp. Silwood1]CAF3939012.1 unnamed protein product [Rotaria sp. Silwood1]CAF3945606.1 unnamed protein product [Rotaria sp. Silwood1]CAF5001702.1 unnamed protein product [Rotaria sp. Silwood1]